MLYIYFLLDRKYLDNDAWQRQMSFHRANWNNEWMRSIVGSINDQLSKND
jgi:hypothetical protein